MAEHRQSEADYEEEDPFGHMACGLQEGPDGHKEGGLHECGDQAIKPGAAIIENEHHWIWQGRNWHCSECWRQCKDKQRAKATCKGMPPSLSKAVTGARQQGHTLAAGRTETGTWCIWCESCGAWGKNKAIRLTGRCLGPTEEGKRVLSRLDKKKHPSGVGHIEQYVKVTVA